MSESATDSSTEKADAPAETANERRAKEERGGFFQHRGHVKLAWLYLHRFSLTEALQRVSESLRMLAAANGAPELYNETLTWAYVFLINERMARLGPAHDWETFAAANADLFDWQNSIVRRYYKPETLDSELAKSIFVMPDLPRG